MAFRPRMAEQARQRAELTLEMFEVAWSDGEMDRTERKRFGAALVDLVASVRVVDAADALSRGIGRATSPRQLDRLTMAYRAVADEWPEDAA